MAISIRSIYKGYSQLGPTIAPKVFALVKSLSAVDWQGCLSSRELDVLKLIGQGKPNQEIASILHLSEGTVKNYGNCSTPLQATCEKRAKLIVC